MVDYIIAEFYAIDYNAEMTFDAVKVLSLFRAFYEELGRKFSPWTNDTLARSWAELTCERDDVSISLSISAILIFSRFVPISATFWLIPTKSRSESFRHWRLTIVELR